MATHSFEQKLARAGEHLDTLDKETAAWIKGEPYGVVDEPDPETPPEPLLEGHRAQRFRINRVSPVPDRFSLLVGDCVFNLRSALDHLALTLALKHSPGMSDDQIGGSEFPVYHSGPMNKGTEEKKIGCIEPTVKAVIKAMQPHHRGADYAADPLWQIHELNRIDKHRTLTVCAIQNSVVDPAGKRKGSIGFNLAGDTNIAGRGYYFGQGTKPLVLDAVLARWSGIPVDPSRDMNMKPCLPLEVVFGNGGPATGQPVVPTLRALRDHVRDVVMAELAKFL